MKCIPGFSLLVLLFFLPGARTQEMFINPVASTIHNPALVIDTHADTPQRFLDEHYDVGSDDPHDPEYISLTKARDGNLGGIFFSIWAIQTPTRVAMRSAPCDS